MYKKLPVCGEKKRDWWAEEAPVQPCLCEAGSGEEDGSKVGQTHKGIIRGGVDWLVTKLAKIKGLGIHMHQLSHGGGGLGRKGWKEYVAVFDQCAARLKKQLHCDLREEMNAQRAGKGTRLTTMMQPTTEGGGDREGATMSNRPKKKRGWCCGQSRD